MRTAFYKAYDTEACEYLRIVGPEMDRRLREGPPLVSANFVIPYPPGFPIMVPGQVVDAEAIGFMRKLDVKEIHGYDANVGLKLIKSSGTSGDGRRATRKAALPKAKVGHR
jgi:arginine decarboxylase